MNGVIGMCGLLLNEISDELHIKKLKIIQNCGKTLLEILNDILDYSKMDAGKIELEHEPFYLRDSLNDVIELLRNKADEKGLQIKTSFTNEIPNFITGDVTRIKQIFTNLICNAIKFSKQGNILVSASVRSQLAITYEIQISVTDNGIGISSDGLKKLFKSFSQADTSTTRKFGGSGLGLRICKGLCEEMGGTIWVESELNKGSTFHFTFKTEKSDSVLKENNKYLVSSEFNDFSKSHPLQILLAEDNNVNQLVIVGMLEKLGYQSDIVSNGLEVLIALSKKDYDVILMDCHMPEMDGFETTEKIRQTYNDKKEPQIIAITASTLKEEIEHCLTSGMDDFLGKPIDFQSLR
jgi:CheY-like chemotaxis protein